MPKVEIEIADDLGGQRQIGYRYPDMNFVFHTIVRAPSGSVFTVGNHFDVCPICKKNEVTYADFEQFMREKMKAAPFKYKA